MTVSLQRALFALVLAVLVVGLLPAGLLLDRRLVAALEEGVREELRAAPLVLSDRFANQASARMMHAREISLSPLLAVAIRSLDSLTAIREASAIVSAFPGEQPLVVGPAGRTWSGPVMPAALVDATRDGSMPVVVVKSGDELGTAALAPVMLDDAWEGAVGVWVPMGSEEAAQLSALTRSDVLIMAPDAELGGDTGRAEPAMGLFGLLAGVVETDSVQELEWSGGRYFVMGSEMPGGARVTFVRALTEDLAILPALRTVGAIVLAIALLFALAVGALFASLLARPVRSLATAVGRVSEGDFGAVVEHSRIIEVDQVASAFEVMRGALAQRITELRAANVELEDRQARLGSLQAELVQRDRLSAAARLLAQLAHEVRNPVASVRNCLEILRRRVQDDPEAAEFADLAIDELLRMHELAEQMLDLHRPRAEGDCDASTVASDVAAVVRMALRDTDIRIVVDAPDPVVARVPTDVLKQVLLNLVQNAQDAIGGSGTIELRVSSRHNAAVVEVADDGPGIDPSILPQIFDPFFTTKSDLHGVGLGLFTADGLMRNHGGRVTARNRVSGPGAVVTVEVPLVPSGETTRREAAMVTAGEA